MFGVSIVHRHFEANAENLHFDANAKITNAKAITLLWYVFFKCIGSSANVIHYASFGYLKFCTDCLI